MTGEANKVPPCDFIAARLKINQVIELRVLTQSFNGRCFLHIREYMLADSNEFVPTAKGIAVALERLDEVLDAVRELRSGGNTDGVYAAIPTSRGGELRFAIATWQGTTKADIRNFYSKSEAEDKLPTKKGFRINLGLLSELERGLEALDRQVSR